MLSIASVRSAGGAAKYFTNDDFVSGEYYTDQDAGDVSQWGGEGIKGTLLENAGAVARDTFESVLKGVAPGGERLEAKDNRRPGYDLTFSAPKSVSLMAYIAGDKRILGPEGAHLKAVQQTMAWVEKNLAEGRKTVDGKTTPVATGNLVYALFQHDTSRALDPQAHVHAIVANMTRMPDGKWQALHADKLWSNNTVIGSIYHAYLRAEMEKLGYKVELQGKHGTFEITGVPKEVIEAFSQRREQVKRASAPFRAALRGGHPSFMSFWIDVCMIRPSSTVTPERAMKPTVAGWRKACGAASTPARRPTETISIRFPTNTQGTLFARLFTR